MNYYLFQGNPDRFAINEYIEEAIATNSNIRWLVTRYATDIAVGDKVFLWRSAGKDAEKSGVVGYARIVSLPMPMPDDKLAKKFWKVEKGDEKSVRVELELLAGKTLPRQLVKREWMVDDPVLSSLGILRMANATNYKLSLEQGNRLLQLTKNTGIDWDKQETLAALWLYNELGENPISKGKDSEVAKIAVQIGRAVTGVYNKVMNFRALDPRDSRDGMSGGGKIARDVWNAYYDSARAALDVEALNSDYERIWGEKILSPPPDNAEGRMIPGEASDDDPADKRLARITLRRGQPAFRKRLLALYDGKCAISGVNVDAVLDAAHIVNHAASGVNHSGNGLLLRSDLHDLFDAGLISIDPEDFTVRIDESLSDSIYADYEGKALAKRVDGSHPDPEFILQKNRSGG